jgi:hypothetical protein
MKGAQIPQAGIPWLSRLAEPKPKPVSYIPYDIPLRVTPRTIVRLVLPADFAAVDAERLCGVLRALAWPGITREAADG